MSFPRYPKYRESGVEWLGEVPAHWELPPLYMRYEVLLGKMLDEKRISGEHLLPYLRNVDVQWDRVNIDALPVMDIVPAERARFTLRSGDLLVCEGGEVGRAAIWSGELACCGYQKAIHRLRPLSSDEVPRFLYYCFAFGAATEIFVAGSNPNTIPHLTAEKLRLYRFPRPSRCEQLCIARFLDRETAKIDALIAEQRRLVELLKEKRQAVISHAVTKGLNSDAPVKPSGVEWLGDVPAHWAVKRLKHLVTHADGIQMGPFGGMLLDLDPQETGYKVYGQENTISGDFTRGGRWISEQRYSALCDYQLRVGDLVLTRKGSLGNARLVQDLPAPGIIDSDTIRVRISSDLMRPEFVTLLLHSAHYVGEQIAINKRGAILAGLNSGIIANIVVLAPPLREQQSIMASVMSAIRRIDDQVEACEGALSLLQERRSALISAAVTGKIDVRGLVDTEAV